VPCEVDAPASALVAALLEYRVEPGRPVLVGVDGRSGAGKSTLSARIRTGLHQQNRTCRVVHLDDLYPGWSGLAAALGPLCHGVLAPLRDGRAGRYRSWDWHGDRPGPHREVPVRDVVLVEGVGALAGPCRDDLDLAVWVETPTPVRRERALARDGAGFPARWDAWAAQEARLLARRGGPPAADVVLDTMTGRLTWARLVP
jgi:hypothetical protein